MIRINQSCNRQCKVCEVYNICSLRHVVQINQEQNSNNLNYENANKERGINESRAL